MSGAEITFRLGRALRIRLEQRGLLTARRPPKPELRSDRPFDLLKLDGVERAPYLEAADQLLEGNQPVFAVARCFEGTRPVWNRDPLTGKVGPLKFGKSIDYRDEALVGNIKYLWEPNRHLELVTLAQAYALSNDARYLSGLRERVDTWIDQCPYPLGVNWASSLEVGIRLINWSLVWSLIGGLRSELFAGDEGEQLVKRWLNSIYQHVHFVRHYYSRYSSANNHLIGEAAGVFVATCAWPHWPEFEKWGEEARRILIVEAKAQTHGDGVNREQAIAYQQFVFDFLLVSALAGRVRGTQFPADYWRTMERMLEFVNAVMDLDGNVPLLGDADDGFVMRLSQEREHCPFRSQLASGALLFDRPHFAASAGALDDKTRWLLGEQNWQALSASGSGTRATVRQTFPDGGYYLLGQDLGTDREIRIVADAGPLGYLSIAAHGHADALSFVLSVAGREILVDPGTYAYHTKPVWRAYFRGTGAHNTVRVDGEDQSMQGGNFMWLQHAQSRCIKYSSDSTESCFVGEHDGYTRLQDPVIHRRAIVQRETMIDVTDSLDCHGYHITERCWHFSERCRVTLEGSTVIAENGSVRVKLQPLEPVTTIRHLRGSEDPPGGWVSRHFDAKVPSDSVYMVNEVRGGTELRTRITIEIRPGA